MVFEVACRGLCGGTRIVRRRGIDVPCGEGGMSSACSTCVGLRVNVYRKRDRGRRGIRLGE